MGQYYRPMVICGNKVKVFRSFDYDNGQKLLEHSYLGNELMNAVFAEIHNNPAKVAWMGDYADNMLGDPYEKKMDPDRFMKMYKRAWNARKFTVIEPLKYEHGGYLVNHTQKIFIDLGKFEDKTGWYEEWKDLRGKMHKDRFAINPLSLLTACGNGRGGGDYHEEHPGYKDVGTWAFDKIEFSEEKPKDYTEKEYFFSLQE